MSSIRCITTASLLADDQKDHLHRHAVHFMSLCFSVYWYAYIASLRKQRDRGTCTDLLLEPKRHVFTAMILAKAVTSFLLPERNMSIMTEKGTIFGLILVMCCIRVIFVIIILQCVQSLRERDQSSLCGSYQTWRTPGISQECTMYCKFGGTAIMSKCAARLTTN
jgi:hypothetical protein